MIVLKSDTELQKIRKSCKIAADILNSLASRIRPGVKTNDLERYAAVLMEKNNCVSAFKGYNRFPAHICVSANDIVVHGIPDETPLREGDIVSIDVGILKDGFYGDTAATFPVGEIAGEAKRLLQVTKEALERGIEMLKVGNRLGSLSNTIERIVESAGFSVVRDFVGHGIGEKMHEDPQIPNFGPADRGPLLRHGMVLAIEPMVNQGSYKVKIDKDGWAVRTEDGLPSAHFEHTVAVLNEGPEVLTTSNQGKQ